MPISPLDLAAARETIEALLAPLDLDAFLYAVEHSERGWLLRVECAAEDGWQVETILLGEELPAASDIAAGLRSEILSLLEQRLAGCKKRG
jgi:hypothetical protein